ncbi:hypothetical protein E9993_10720 [Labilibacter sediminis]|nr:hypothetical protein E9993_10720 [Labilibacter sediminis]
MNRVKCKKLFLFFLFGLSCLFTRAQSDFGGFENLGKREGMFHTNTRALYKDSKDFLWIGSSDGLMRYDGVVFDLFRRGKKDTVALSDNTINCIIEDASDYVFWIGTDLGGLNRFDITKNQYNFFYIEPEPKNNRGIVQIISLFQINEDCILVGTKFQGLYFFYPSLQKFVKLNEVCKEKVNLPKEIYQIIEGDNFIWVTGKEGLVQFEKNGDFRQIYFFNGKSFFNEPVDKSQKVGSLYEKDKHEIVFTSNNKLFKFNWLHNEIQELLKLEANVELNKVILDNKGGYWIGSGNNGLYFFNEKSNNIVHFDANNGKENNIVNNQIQDLCFFKDQSILWIGTRKGISKYDYNKIKFSSHNINKLTKGKVNDPYMIAKDSKQGYWLWSQQGLFYKRKDQKYYSELKTPKGFAAYRVIEDDESNMWFATNQGLMQYNLESNTTKFHKFYTKGCDDSCINFLTYIVSDEQDIAWIASRTGIIRFNLKTHQYTVFPIRNEKAGIDYRFTSMEYSNDKKFLWLASRRGKLWRFDVEQNSYKRFDINVEKREKQIVILDIELSQDGKVWLATYGGGLLIYDPEKQELSDELAIGLLESYVYGILSDEEGDFWMSSNFGISKVNPKTKKVIDYQERDGTFCEEFNDKSYFKTKQGEMLFGGTSGFIEFTPSKLFINQYQAKLYINSYTVQNEVLEYGDEFYDDVTYLNDSVISIESSKSTIKFYASLLNYSHSWENKIEWKLEGHDEQWNKGYSFAAITYNNINPGTYKLRVKGMNNDGFELSKEASLLVIIKARYYETVAFKIIILLLIVIFLVFLYQVRISWYLKQEKLLTRKVEEKTKELVIINEELEISKDEILVQKAELEVHRNYLEELVKNRTKDLEIAKQKAEESDRLKTAFLANLSHEIRTPMNAIIGFSSLLQTNEFPEEQKKEFLKVIGQSSESLLVLINDIIDISRIETGNISIVKQDVNIPILVKETLDELVFEEKSQDVKFMQLFELAPHDQEIYTDRFRLKQIISNLVRNAFKFTKEGHVKLSVKSVQPEELTDLGFHINGRANKDFHPIFFEIEDTGIGIDENDIELIFEPFRKAKSGAVIYQGMGLGLSIVNNLLTLFGGDIMVKSELDKGTKFSFYINAKPEISS